MLWEHVTGTPYLEETPAEVYILNLVEEVVNPPKRTGKSDIGRKTYIYLVAQREETYDTLGKLQVLHCYWSKEW